MLKKTAISISALFAAALIYYGFNLLYPFKYIDIIEKNAGAYGLTPEFVCAVIHAESRFDAGAISKKGAGGLMQITEPTADWAAEELRIANYSYADLFEPETNILIGCWYLGRLNRQFGNVTDTVLAAYNAGSGNVANWLSSPEYSRDGENLHHVPFGETRLYIKKVNENVKIYGFLIGLRRMRK